MVPLPPLVTRSRPWSKNWPKNVIQELNGAERPTSGAEFGMKSVWRSSAVPNSPSRPGLVTSSPVSSSVPSTPSSPAAAATAAGLLAVWSTSAFEISRGSESNTQPLVCA